MPLTPKYGLHEIDYSTQGWDNILATDMEKLDDVIPSRLLATLGETVAAYQALYLKDADTRWYKAQANGLLQPCLGIALEAGDAGDQIRVVRLGEVTNAAWAWTDIGQAIYLDPSTAGGMTQTMPAVNVQTVGYALSATEMVAICHQLLPSVGTAGGTVISQNTVAGESIAAGDVVGSFRNGIRKGYGLLAGSAELDQIGAGLNVLSCCWLTSSLLILAYIKSADAKVYATALTVNANWSVTAGAEQVIANYACYGGIKIRRGSDTTFVVAWLDNAGVRTGRLFASACSVGALNAITVGAEAEINPTSSVYTAGANSFDFRLLTTLTFLFAYRDSGDSSYLRACVVTWNAGTLALTVAADVRMVAAAADDVAIAILSTTRAHVHYESGGTGHAIQLIKIAGTVPSAGTAYAGALTAALSGMDAAPWNDCWSLFTCNFGTTFVVNGFGYQSGPELCYAGNTNTLLATNGGGGKARIFTAGRMAIIIWTDGTASLWKWNLAANKGWQPLSQFQGGYIHAMDSDMDADLDPSNTALAVFFTDVSDGPHHGHLLIYDVGRPIGVAAEANAGGSALAINIGGKLTVGGWGLTPQKRHHALVAGTLTLTPNGFPMVKALSATEGLILGEFETL